jgi:hypothetical protein
MNRKQNQESEVVKFYETSEFITLNAKWKQYLEASGFVDIEDPITTVEVVPEKIAA